MSDQEAATCDFYPPFKTPRTNSTTMVRAIEAERGVLAVINDNFDQAEAEQLEVKWYFNEDPAPFFQWIAGVEDSQPQLIGSLFEDKIDLTFLASSDKHTRHRALLLQKPTIEMAGTAAAEQLRMMHSNAQWREHRTHARVPSRILASTTTSA